MNGIAAQSVRPASPDTKYPASSVLSDAYSFYRIIFSCQAMPAPAERLPKLTLTAFRAESYVDAEANFSEEHTRTTIRDVDGSLAAAGDPFIVAA
jgi:hypothetical protein